METSGSKSFTKEENKIPQHGVAEEIQSGTEKRNGEEKSEKSKTSHSWKQVKPIFQ